MRTAQLRKKLHQYIDLAQDKKLKAIFVMIEDDFESQSLLTTSQKKELDKRYSDYKTGKGKSFSWNEVKKSISKEAKSFK